MNKIFKQIEALMYIQGDLGISPNDLKTVNESTTTSEARKSLKEFKEYFNEQERGIQITEFNDVFKMATKEEFKNDVAKLVTTMKKQKLSTSAIETAGIVAYKQPVTKSQINQIRGVSSEAVVNTLLVKGIIEEQGIASTPGQPILYGITNKFYDYFRIKSLKELPQLSQLDESEGIEDEDFELFSSQREDNN